MNPSGVSKLLWFRFPDNWYMYDRYAANAVGAAPSSVRGMVNFFSYLEATGVSELNRVISARVAESGLNLRSERIIDKYLWLRGDLDGRAVTESTVAREAHEATRTSGFEEFAREMNELLVPDRFGL